MKEKEMQSKLRQALNKAFLKVRPYRDKIEDFKSNLRKLIETINERESEEFNKNIVSYFLKNTYYHPDYFINTKGRNDLVIHNGKDAKSSVGVILEVKRPANKNEMLKVDNLNKKAFHELLLYFLRERITGKNLEIRYLIVTNIYECFIFDAHIFEKKFTEDKDLVKSFIDFEQKILSGTTTELFYIDIAKPKIDKIKDDIPFTFFDIREYQKYLDSAEKEDDSELIALFKLLSPEHLLKLPFANDSNSLDKGFYNELLHIIGLEEIKKGNKKIIGRKEENPDTGSLIENAINQLDSLDKIRNIKNHQQFGNTKVEKLFNVALELAITWINRILFLKLLEAQLIKYHKGDQSFAFLNLQKVKNYHDINHLFFNVLARKPEERDQSEQKDFLNVPYLNSSLFEVTDIENLTIAISSLPEKELSIFPSTVLKKSNGEKQTGQLNTLQYLLDFLNAYDFSSEGSEAIQEDNKRLISASVLGLIFSKINGYKDGSYFTPGFITMYMCRETISRAVLQKFNQEKHWDCQNLNELYHKIEPKKEAKQEANRIINSLKICDPAVGSGHFLVSALNEIIALKKRCRDFCQDETRLGLKTITRRKITLKGIKPQGIVQWKRDNFYLYGVVEPLTGESYFYEFSHLDKEGFQLFINQVSQVFPTSLNFVQIDNAPAHQGIDWPENIIPIFQPTYSPELNPIERFWEELKAELSWDNFQTLDQLRQRISTLLLKFLPEDLRSIIGWEYITEAILSATS